MSQQTFYLRCWLCLEIIEVPFGPECHTEAVRLLREHVDGHTIQKLANYARQKLLGDYVR